MRIQPNENIEDWAERVCVYEIDRANRSLKNNESVDSVLDTLATGIKNKILHAFLLAIRESCKKEINMEEDRRRYFSVYTNLNPVADHIVDQKSIDNFLN